MMRAGRMSALGALLTAAVLVAQAATPAMAQDWPSKPVTLVVPYGPGGSNDVLTRAAAASLSEQFGQPFVVENIAGAGGLIGANHVKEKGGDGYTFLQGGNGLAALKPIMQTDFDLTTDMVTVAYFAQSPDAMVIPASLPVTTVAEFIDYAKQNEGSMYYGFVGQGGSGQLDAELFKKQTGIEMEGVSYKSAAEALTDVAAGRLHAMFSSVPTTLGLIEGGQLRLLAYTNDSAAEGAPDAPSMEQAGVSGMGGSSIWWAFFAPADLPQDILTKMNEAVHTALKDARMVELMRSNGATPLYLSPSESTAKVADEVEQIAAIAKEANITAPQ